MNIKNQVTFLITVTLVACTFIACQKKEIKGPQGDSGTAGGGGNTNISTTNVFVVTSAQWVPDSAAATWKVTVPSPLITKNVMDKGVVKVAVQVENEWWEMPYIGGDLVTQFGFKEGFLHIAISDIHEVLRPRPATQNFRMVILTEN